MIRRETDANFINRIVNTPGVRENVCPGDFPLDFAPIVDRPATETGIVALSDGDDALGVFAMTADGIWQSHTLFGPHCRGRAAIDTAKEMVAYMFRHGANTVWGATPRSNKAACWFNRQIGAVEIGGDDEDAIFEIRKTVH